MKQLKEDLGDKIVMPGADWNCGGADLVQPQEKAVRRCAGAQGADAGDRPLGQRARAVAGRDRQDGRQHRVPGLAAGADQGRAAANRRLLARHREVAGRGAPSAEGGRAGEPHLRTAQPQRRPALQVQRHLGRRSVEQDRRQRNAARAADRALVRRAAQRRIRASGLAGNCQDIVNPLLDVHAYLPRLGQSVAITAITRTRRYSKCTKRRCTRTTRKNRRS